MYFPYGFSQLCFKHGFRLTFVTSCGHLFNYISYYNMYFLLGFIVCIICSIKNRVSTLLVLLVIIYCQCVKNNTYLYLGLFSWIFEPYSSVDFDIVRVFMINEGILVLKRNISVYSFLLLLINNCIKTILDERVHRILTLTIFKLWTVFMIKLTLWQYNDNDKWSINNEREKY